MLATRFARPFYILAAVACGLVAVTASAEVRTIVVTHTTVKRPAAIRKGSTIHRSIRRKHAYRSPSHSGKSVTRQLSAVLPVLQDADLNGLSIEIDGGTVGVANAANMYPVAASTSPINTVSFPLDALNTLLGVSTLKQSSPNDVILNLEPSPNPTVIDWVKDMLPNTDAASCINGLAEGIIPNSLSYNSTTGDNPQTGAIDPTNASNGARGHWYGQRIIDGIATAEQDIFIKGGKENSPSTWQVGPGSVGSAKYDITQCFLANTTYATANAADFPSGNKNMLFFGMERRGNDGTTAYDFEFDQNPPTGLYIPNRTDGDVLFTFEMQGSSTNVATPHVYLYKSSIPGFDLSNDLAGALGPYNPLMSMNFGNTPSAPWGHVNSKGAWAVEPEPNAEFAEAVAYYGPDTKTHGSLGILPFIDKCGGKAYVQIRTRSSVTATSDLKDTTKFFVYQFPQPLAVPANRANCSQGFFFNGNGSKGSSPAASLTYTWTFTVDPSVTLTGDGFLLSPVAGQPGVYTSPAFTDGVERHVIASGLTEAGADVNGTLTVAEGPTCKDMKPLAKIHVFQDLAAAAPALTGVCNSRTISYSGLITGGQAPINYEWDIYKVGNSTAVTKIPGNSGNVHVVTSGTFTPTDDGSYYAVLNATDGRFDPANPTVCAVHPQSATVDVYGPILPAPSLTGSCNVRDITYGDATTGGKGPYTYAWTFFKKGSPDTQVGTSTSQSGTFTPPSDGDYYATLVVTDSHIVVGASTGCTGLATGPTVSAASPMNPTAVKTSADGTAMTVLMTGAFTAPGNGQWQRLNAASNTWGDISGQTGSTLTYSSFVADDPSPTTYSDTTDGSPFKGKIYHVQVRLKTTRTINGVTCTSFSDPVTIKMIVAVDP